MNQNLKYLIVFLIFSSLYYLAVITTKYDEKEAKTTNYKFPKQYKVKYNEEENGVEFNVFHKDGTKERIIVNFDLRESDIAQSKSSLYLGHMDMSSGEDKQYVTFRYPVALITLESKDLAFPLESQIKEPQQCESLFSVQ